MATFSSIRPAVILYSYHMTKPVDLSSHVKSVSVQLSLAASTYNQAQIVLEKAWMGEVPVVGDWVQVDLLQSGYRYSEHIFFGVIKSIQMSAATLGFPT